MQSPVRLPAPVLKALAAGLRMRAAGLQGAGLKPRTVSEARSMLRTGEADPGKVARMAAWLARHGPPEREAAALTAWLLWGGDDAARWLRVRVGRPARGPRAASKAGATARRPGRRRPRRAA